MEIIDSTLALRSANHLYRRLAEQGVPTEDLERLATIREWIRGMKALDIMAEAGLKP